MVATEETGGKKEEKTDDYSGHYVIASRWPPERRPLERHTLVPIRDYSKNKTNLSQSCGWS